MADIKKLEQVFKEIGVSYGQHEGVDENQSCISISQDNGGY